MVTSHQINTEDSTFELPLSWDGLWNGWTETNETKTHAVSDALIISLSNLGKVDIEYISSITGKSHADIIAALKGSIYQNPETWNETYHLGWETTEEYLSGNLMRKWRQAYEANQR